MLRTAAAVVGAGAAAYTLKVWLPPGRDAPPAYTPMHAAYTSATHALAERETTRGCVHTSVVQFVCDPPPKYHAGMRGYEAAPIRTQAADRCQPTVRIFEACPGRGNRELTDAPVALARPPAAPLRIRASAGRTALWRVQPVAPADARFVSKVGTRHA